jgi:membrane protease YdiL (CAAX protease family)
MSRPNRDAVETDATQRRRQVTVAATLVVGAALLGFSLSVKPGDSAFYYSTIALAAVWGLGGILSGPLHLGRMAVRGAPRRPVVTPVELGFAAAAVFIVGSLIAREIPPVRDVIEGVLVHARRGSLPLVALITVVNGVAEEIFFRGALFAAIGQRRPVALSTAIYGLVTVTTGNVMLVFSALVLGLLLGQQRRASGGILGPILTHVTWSTVMLLALPPIFAAG